MKIEVCVNRTKCTNILQGKTCKTNLHMIISESGYIVEWVCSECGYFNTPSVKTMTNTLAWTPPSDPKHFKDPKHGGASDCKICSLKGGAKSCGVKTVQKEE